MKPKTKIELAVKSIEHKLPELTAEQIDYADNRLFEKLCYATKLKSFCLECGSDINVNLFQNGKVQCPICNEKLKVVMSRKIKDFTPLKTFAFASIIKVGIYDFQVTRCFEIRCRYRKGEKKSIVCWEINQRWYDKNSKKVVINSMIENGYSGNYTGDLQIRKGYFNYKYYSAMSYDPFPFFFLPDSKFRPDLIRSGITAKRLENIRFSMLIDKINESPKIETLLKMGYVEVLEKWSINEIEDYWPALKICFRNKYKIKQIQSYKDLLEALFFLNKDLHNAHYVCPKDFVESHDKFINLKTKKQLADSGLTDSKKIELANPRYIKEKSKFLNLKFTSGKITVQPLQNVEEFYEEGKLFKHCIFTNAYFDKKNSLLFSARYEGIRIETFELSLTTFKILQSHGLGHNISKHSEKIKDLILRNISQVKKCMETYKRKRTKKAKII